MPPELQACGLRQVWLAPAPALVIAEGYATAATLAEALQHGTVAAFDSGGLTAVAEALGEKFSDQPVVIAGDDDRCLEATQAINPGKVKAQEAAKAVGGKAIEDHERKRERQQEQRQEQHQEQKQRRAARIG